MYTIWIFRIRFHNVWSPQVLYLDHLLSPDTGHYMDTASVPGRKRHFREHYFSINDIFNPVATSQNTWHNVIEDNVGNDRENVVKTNRSCKLSWSAKYFMINPVLYKIPHWRLIFFSPKEKEQKLKDKSSMNMYLQQAGRLGISHRCRT